jgi:hypothetical protein
MQHGCSYCTTMPKRVSGWGRWEPHCAKVTWIEDTELTCRYPALLICDRPAPSLRLKTRAACTRCSSSYSALRSEGEYWITLFWWLGLSAGICSCRCSNRRPPCRIGCDFCLRPRSIRYEAAHSGIFTCDNTFSGRMEDRHVLFQKGAPHRTYAVLSLGAVEGGRC